MQLFNLWRSNIWHLGLFLGVVCFMSLVNDSTGFDYYKEQRKF